MFRRHFKKAMVVGLLALLLAVLFHGFGHSRHTHPASTSTIGVSTLSGDHASDCSLCAFARRVKSDGSWMQTLIHLAWIPQGKIFPFQQVLQFLVFALLLFSRAPPL